MLLRVSSDYLHLLGFSEIPPVATTEEVLMFARRVAMHLKPNCVTEFTERLENEIIPLLRKQNGFQDEITFTTTGGKEAIAISLWDRTENAEAYNRETYPQIVKTLSRFVEGTPQVETYQVANSTFHKIAAAVTV